MSKLVVVFGGSGFIGTQVVRALTKRGYRVRVPMRRPHLGASLRVTGEVGQVQLVQANVRFPESVDAALEGADAVVNLIGVLHDNGKQGFEPMHVDAARAIAEAAKRRGISVMAHVSAIGAAPTGAQYARTKYRGEEAVREALPTATVLRPSIVFGPDDGFFNRFGEMVRNPLLHGMFGFVPLIGGGKTKFQPIYVGDVADAVCAALEREDARGRTYELGGPATYSFRQLIEFIRRETGRNAPLLPLPFFIAQPIGLLVGWLFALIPFVDPPITSDQVTLLKRDNVVGSEAGVGVIQDLGVTQLESIEAIVPSYIWRFRPYGQFQTRQNPA